MQEIDISKLSIPFNYVLIKLDPDHDTYHSRESGENTGLYVAPWGANQASHIGVTGTVAVVPDNLIFNGYEMAGLKKELRDGRYPSAEKYNEERQKKIANLKRESVSYDVPIEVRKGMRVYFEYTTRLDAIKEGRALYTESGNYLFIPYDLLIMYFMPYTNFDNVQISDVRMLNGFVLIKILEYATEKNSAGIVGFKTEMDLFLPESKRPDAKYVHKGNGWYANVLAAGCEVKSYVDFPNAGGDRKLTGIPGQKILFDGRQKKRLEVEHHRVIFKKYIFHRIHRKDIMGWFPDGNINGMPKI